MKTDSQIQQDVMDQLQWNPMLDAAEIGVSVRDGIVTLSGIVDSYAKKVAAENDAKKVAGVKAVAEDIQVGLSPLFKKTDTEIADAILRTYKWNSAVPESKIKVKVEDGNVTLEGQVDWFFQRSAAKDSIEHLIGIRHVNNYITVAQRATPADVKSKIISAFYRSAALDADKIQVDIIGNHVTLTGKVRSFAEKDDAAIAAWSAPGVSTVDNQIELAAEEYAL